VVGDDSLFTFLSQPVYRLSEGVEFVDVTFEFPLDEFQKRFGEFAA